MKITWLSYTQCFLEMAVTFSKIRVMKRYMVQVKFNYNFMPVNKSICQEVSKLSICCVWDNGQYFSKFEKPPCQGKPLLKAILEEFIGANVGFKFSL